MRMKLAIVVLGLAIPVQSAWSGEQAAPAEADAIYHEAAPALSNEGPETAFFQGRRIDLTKGWGRARACLALPLKTLCFRSSAALDRRLAREMIKTDGKVQPQASCSSALQLFQHTLFGGRRLVFYGRGYWQNLGAWGFNDELSSYSVGRCSVHLAEHNYGHGYWYPGNTGAGSSEARMRSGWNDRVSSIYIR